MNRPRVDIPNIQRVPTGQTKRQPNREKKYKHEQKHEMDNKC